MNIPEYCDFPECNCPGPERCVKRRPHLEKLIEAARDYAMSLEEKEAQRQSWVRGEMAIGLDRDEEEYRRKMRENPPAE